MDAGSRPKRQPRRLANRTAGIRRRSDRPGHAAPAGHPSRSHARPGAAAADATWSIGLWAAEPAAERLPALLHDRNAGRDPDPGAAPPEGPHPAGPQRVALPAPRRRPPRAGLRQRRLPDAALQPVRLLRGRADAGVIATGGLSYDEALRALGERGRFGIRLGLGRTRALLRELGDPQLGLRGALI